MPDATDYEIARLTKMVTVLTRQMELLIAALDRNSAIVQADTNARQAGR